MKNTRVLMLGAASAILNAVGGWGLQRFGIQRTPAGTKRGRQMVSKGYRNRSKYMPHQGAKERERAKRCYESEFLNQQLVSWALANGVILCADQCHERSTPTICQRAR